MFSGMNRANLWNTKQGHGIWRGGASTHGDAKTWETSVYFPGWQKEKGSPGRRKQMYGRIITRSERRQDAWGRAKEEAKPL